LLSFDKTNKIKKLEKKLKRKVVKLLTNHRL